MKFDKPFPHVITNRLFNPEKLREVVRQWPDDCDANWKSYEGGKRAFHHFDSLPTVTQTVVGCGMTGGFLVPRISAELGIHGLIPDDTLHGAGLHETLRGGRLGMHVDFNQHPKTGLYRRVNAILYLNDDWSISDGGALILSTGDESSDVVISPRLGMFVAWEVGDDRWHGHPDPLECESRKSIAWYFYTVEKPPGFSEKHGTIYR